MNHYCWNGAQSAHVLEELGDAADSHCKLTPCLNDLFGSDSRACHNIPGIYCWIKAGLRLDW